MSETFFKSVHITNFKSLESVTLRDCKRINVLIGKPNVGKSNILEAIGLFSLPYIRHNKSKKITQFVRMENIMELFFNGDTHREAIISTDQNHFCKIKYYPNNFLDKPRAKIKNSTGDFEYITLNEDTDCLFIHQQREGPFLDLRIKFLADNTCMQLDDLLNVFNLHNYKEPQVKYYRFPSQHTAKKPSKMIHCLIPPFGVNLLNAIQLSGIEKDFVNIFREYGLNLLFDKANNSLRVMKLLQEDHAMISFPYSSVADTLQRVIFFKTAIASNKNAILLFEEPEAHSFPPYIKHIAQEVIDAKTNQFFIATHSPFIVDTFLENARSDLAIFMADLKEGQTVIKRLSDAEVNDVYDYGVDLFFNAELFTDEIQH